MRCPIPSDLQLRIFPRGLAIQTLTSTSSVKMTTSFLYDEIEMLAMDDCSEENTPVPDLDRMVPEGEEEEEEYDWDSDLDVDVQVVPCSMRDLTRREKEARRTKELTSTDDTETKRAKMTGYRQ
ncbi:hypothetical protein BG003_009804 [Podila horticola]|nr:hypothetical protein BG003_009804 [Podila horticola]